VFIQGKNFFLSAILHFILLFLIILIFRRPPSSLPLPQARRTVSVRISSQTAPRSNPPSRSSSGEKAIGPVKPALPPVTAPLRDEPTENRDSPVPVTVPPPSQAPLPDKTGEEMIHETVLPPIEENFSYSYHEDLTNLLTRDEPEIPEEDFLLDDLLITGETGEETSGSLYSIDLAGSPSRKILETPELSFDLSDPVLATLQNCRISFTVSEEGLVRDIEMIPPGTGSTTYDEILENLISRFLFTPGDRDRGVMGINFSTIYGENGE